MRSSPKRAVSVCNPSKRAASWESGSVRASSDILPKNSIPCQVSHRGRGSLIHVPHVEPDPSPTTRTRELHMTNHKRHGSSRGGATQAPPAEGAVQNGTEAAAQQDNRARGLNIGELKDMSIQKLTQVAKELNVAGATGMRKQELIFQILKAQTEQSGFIFSEVVL